MVVKLDTIQQEAKGKVLKSAAERDWERERGGGGGEEFSMRGALIQFVKPVEFLSPLEKKSRESGYLFRFGKALSSDVAPAYLGTEFG